MLNPPKEMAQRSIPSEIRVDPLTGRTARIWHFMGLKWEKPDFNALVSGTEKWCPFCDDKVLTVTPCFPTDAAQPIQIQGKFVADIDFIEFTDIFLEDEDKRVIILIIDEETDDVYLYEFDYDGFGINLWPGLYSFYTLIIDSIDDEVIGIGYPDFGNDEDPNPIQLSGEGMIEGDFIIFDADEL